MIMLYMSFIDDEKHRRLFEEIYLNYRKQMFLVAHSILGNDSDAEDIVHDIFLKIAKKHMEKISKIENNIDLRNYLLKAAKNTALDHIRKHQQECLSIDFEDDRGISVSDDMWDDTFVEQICNNSEYEMVVSSIASLKDIYREVLYYHFVLELSIPEVAKLLDCKVSTVKQRLVRGKKLLYVQIFGEVDNDA